MTAVTTTRPSWKALLNREKPLLLPCAHDALSARLIERAGFAAYAIGGYALVGSRYAIPDIGLVGFGEMSAGIRDIISASNLPVMIDADNGYGDVKNVAHTVRGYEAMGVSALFMEDQTAPKRCGHMAGKTVIDAREMAAKIRAAAGARRSPERRCGAAKSILRPAPTDCSSRRPRPSTNSRGSARHSRVCRKSQTWWKAAARRRCCRRRSSIDSDS
jgi:2-methylisocitrate lyase-like PEP mutase family enzyme